MKKKTKRKIRNILLLLTIFLAIVVFLFAFSGVILKIIFNKTASKLTGVETKVNRIKIYPINGECELQDIVVGNPIGYKSPYAFRSSRIYIKYNPSSIFKSVVVIKQITVESPEIVYEWNIKGLNINKIKENIESSTTLKIGKNTNPIPTPPANGYIIENVDIKDIQLKAGSTYIGVATIPAPKNLNFKNLSSDNQHRQFTKIITDVIADVFETVGKIVKK